MDKQRARSNWKIYLGLAGAIIILISLFYTGYLAQQLRDGERNKALLLFDAYETISNANPEPGEPEPDLTLPSIIIESNEDIPIMVVSESGEVLSARNFGPE